MRVIILTSVTTRSVVESSIMSSQPLVAEVASLQTSRAAETRQLSSGDAHHVSPSIVTRESLQDSIDAVNELRISDVHAKPLTADMTFEEAMADIRTLNHPLCKIMVKYHEATNIVRSDELQWMRTIQSYHCELRQFLRLVKEKRLSLDELDQQMDMHSAQLREYDVQLTAWFDHRGQENAIMTRGNDHVLEENVCRYQENVRREEHDRRGHSRWFKDHARWLLDHARRAKEHNRWVLEYDLWVLTYDRFSQQRSRNLKEYKELFIKQAYFSRSIGNYQIARFFEEVERLNDAACDSVKEEPSHASKLNNNRETLQDHATCVGGGMEQTEMANGNQVTFEDGMERVEAKKRRRHSL